MTAVVAAIAALLLLGTLSAAWSRNERWAAACGASAPLVALILSLPAAWIALSGARKVSGQLPWSMPAATFHVELDGLSAFFLLTILGLASATAVYGLGYLRGGGCSVGWSWFFFNTLIASMMVVVLARSVILFLLAWETMALSSFFLVAHDSDRREVRQAAWTYLVATHLGSLFLLPMFFLMAEPSGSLDFTQLGSGLAPATASVCFVLAVIGFGTKAGLMPFHVWLPEAHPAAPSHVSALMSGVMIKTGVYGLLRVLTCMGEPPLWWGLALLALGGISALLGVLFALAQHDLKRLLAYHSVENIGIIFLGMGLGVTGLAIHVPAIAMLGFVGCLLHVLNHALFKGLLFLGAGSVLHATHTSEIDELGGLARRMPVTATTFLVGSVAISGLPPLNGFVSEFLIYWGSLAGTVRAPIVVASAFGITAAVLAAVGGLALACFTKAFGIVFLGHPRSSKAATVHEAERSMTGPMVALAAGCLALGMAGPVVVIFLAPTVVTLAPGMDGESLRATAILLGYLSLIGGLLLGLIALLALVRRALLEGRTVAEGPTWDCGYAALSPTMQYTASSFAQPLVDLFRPLLRTRKRIEAPELHFPDAAHVETETPDLSREGIYEPLFETVERTLGRIRVLQHGRVQIYVLGVVLTLLGLLLWQVR